MYRGIYYDAPKHRSFGARLERRTRFSYPALRFQYALSLKRSAIRRSGERTDSFTVIPQPPPLIPRAPSHIGASVFRLSRPRRPGNPVSASPRASKQPLSKRPLRAPTHRSSRRTGKDRLPSARPLFRINIPNSSFSNSPVNLEEGHK